MWYKKVKSKRRGKLDARWASAVFLGVREESGEIILGTKDGVLKARSFRRKGSAEERWNKEEILGVRGLPWQPVPGGPGMDIRSSVRLPEERGEVRQPETEEREYRQRRFKIFRKDLATHGYTIGCPGCIAAQNDQDPKNHSEECRDRIAQALGQAGDSRIMREAERQQQELEEQQTREVEPPQNVSADVGMGEGDSRHEGAPGGDGAAREDPGDAMPELLPSEPGEDDRSMREVEDSDSEDEEDTDMANHIFSITLNPRISKRMGVWEQELEKQKGKARWSDDVEAMENALKTEGVSSHVSEIYSRPRVTSMAEQLGLIPGMSLDLATVDPDDGKPWDFNVREKREKALKLVFTRRSLLLIGSPMCSAFSQIQSLNWSRMSPEKVLEVKEYGRKHLEFCLKLYNLQMELGLYFLHEHPAHASS